MEVRAKEQSGLCCLASFLLGDLSGQSTSIQVVVFVSRRSFFVFSIRSQNISKVVCPRTGLAILLVDTNQDSIASTVGLIFIDGEQGEAKD